MNVRTKLLNVLNFNVGEPIPEWEFAYWYDTVERWYGEGLPRVKPTPKIPYQQWLAGDAMAKYEYDVHNYFGFDEWADMVAVNPNAYPPFKKIVYEEDEEDITYRREDGKVIKTKKDGSSMPNFLKYPVKNEQDFEDIKVRFNPDEPKRFPPNWEELVSQYKNRSFPLFLGGNNVSGFYSIIREFLGVEDSLYAFYDQPDLVIKILDFFVDYYIKLYSKILQQVEVDCIFIWEDMCFKNGPLVSPSIFKKFIVPYYKKFTDKMKELGVKHFIVDTDGNFEVLIPLFIEGGVTGFYPFEVQAGMDIEKIRSMYPQLVIFGGINKMVLSQGKVAIDHEVEKVGRMLEKGGYLPYTDHMVPPEVSFENYVYFRKKLKEVLEKKRS